jgi:hypothetical protein
MSVRSIFPTLSVMTLLAVAEARAQTFAYLTTLGTDTLALEQYDRRGNIITGDYATVVSGILIHHYIIHVANDGSIDRMTMTVGRRGQPAVDTLGFAVAGDTTELSSNRWPERVRRVRAPGFYPMFVGVNALEETAVTFARSQRRDSLTIPIFAMWANFDTAHFRVLMYSADSVGLWSRITPGVLKLDRNGHVVRASARLTTTRTETVRVPVFDMSAVLGNLRDAPTSVPVSAFATLSPRDSLETSLGDAHIRVTYGRPALRGRDVFDHGVLGDTVWRTGANGPTEFVTDRDMLIAGKLLPAGRYTLWTRITENNSAYWLVFSSQSGRGCMDYHPEHDVVQVRLAVGSLNEPIDRLTLRLEPNGSNGRFVIEWGLTRLWTRMSVFSPPKQQ